MKLKSLLSQITTAAVLAAGAAAAQADTYAFSLTGSYVASWTMDSNVSPDVDFEDEGFIKWDVEGTFPDSLLDMVDLTFYNASLGGGLAIEDFYGSTTLMVADGPQLYSGSEASPTLLTGTFNLTEYNGTGTYTLTVTNLSAVPEPASVALLLGGLGLVGAAARRRKTEAETV